MRELTDPDGSVNRIYDLGPGQAIETRLVQRQRDEIIIYLSSQTACEMGCRMCHLTRTGQTKPTNCTADEIIDQATEFLNEDSTFAEDGVAVVNFNFMARGEPLDNPHVDEQLLLRLNLLAKGCGLTPRFKISTVMPQVTQREDLVRRFGVVQPDLYYSFYSADPDFRRRWFPKALPYRDALDILAGWQRHTHKIPIIHFPAIRGINDGRPALSRIVREVRDAELRADYRVIRYNPFDASGPGVEGDYQGVVRILREISGADVQLIERIGPEAKASCGMFVEGQ